MSWYGRSGGRRFVEEWRGEERWGSRVRRRWVWSEGLRARQGVGRELIVRGGGLGLEVGRRSRGKRLEGMGCIVMAEVGARN